VAERPAEVRVLMGHETRVIRRHEAQEHVVPAIAETLAPPPAAPPDYEPDCD
jgi:hypothetical protein